MRRLFYIAIVILAASPAFSQRKTYLSLEIGPSWDLSRVEDPGNYFSSSHIPGTYQGLAIWQEILPNVNLGTGVYFHSCSFGINPSDSRPHQVSIHSYSTLTVPLRLSYRGQLADLPLCISPVIGYQYGIIPATPALLDVGSVISDSQGNTIQYTLSEEMEASSSLHLFEAGVNAEYRFDNNWQLTFSLSFLGGLKDIKTSHVAYLDSEGANHPASYTNDGSRIQSALRLDIPVSNLWEKKDLRTHMRIEQSGNRGKALKVRRYIYFGGDIGSLRRSFSTTNPAVGARPLEGRGLFRYANLHTGLYMGFKFSETTGIDLGAYYQRSSTFFSLMYDHENDFIYKERAPLYLEFPLSMRYYFDVYENDLYIVPSIGFSVLTHFSSGEYNPASGTFNLATTTGPTDASVSGVSTRLVRFGYSVHAGAAAEYRLPVSKPLFLSLKLTYNYGLRTVEQQTIITSLPETPEESLVNYRGSGWRVSLGLEMPIVLGKENRRCGAIPIRR